MVSLLRFVLEFVPLAPLVVLSFGFGLVVVFAVAPYLLLALRVAGAFGACSMFLLM